MKNLMRHFLLYLFFLSCSIPLHSMEQKFKPRALLWLATITGHIKKSIQFDAKEPKEEGFASGTLVYTTQGMRPIQEILRGDKVLSYDRFTNSYQESVVARTCQKKVKSFVRLYVNDQEIESNGDQKFLDENKEWRYTWNLEPGTRLLSYDLDSLVLTKLEKINQAKILYVLTLQGPRNFAIGKNKLLVHNGRLATALGLYRGGQFVWKSIQAVNAFMHSYAAATGTAAVAAESGAMGGMGIATLSTSAATGATVTGAAGSAGVIATLASNPIGWTIAAGGTIYIGVQGYRAYKNAKNKTEFAALKEIEEEFLTTLSSKHRNDLTPENIRKFLKQNEEENSRFMDGGQKPHSVPKIPGANPGQPGGGLDPKDMIKKALEWIMNQKPNKNGENNKLNHLFGQNGKHRLDFLIKELGGQQAVISAVLKELVVHKDLPLLGTFKDIGVQVCGKTIEVSGAVIDGIPLIGTMALERNAIL